MKVADLTWGKMKNEAQDRAQWRKPVGGLCSNTGATKACVNQVSHAS